MKMEIMLAFGVSVCNRLCLADRFLLLLDMSNIWVSTKMFSILLPCLY